MSPSHGKPGHLATPRLHLTEPLLQPDRNLTDLLRVTAPEAHLGDLLMRIELELHLRMEGEGMRHQGIMEAVVDIRGVPGGSSFLAQRRI